MGTNSRTPRRRRSDWGPTYVLWWLMWLVILWWPMLVSPVLEVFWLLAWAAFGLVLLRQNTRRPGPRARP